MKFAKLDLSLPPSSMRVFQTIVEAMLIWGGSYERLTTPMLYSMVIEGDVDNSPINTQKITREYPCCGPATPWVDVRDGVAQWAAKADGPPAIPG